MLEIKLTKSLIGAKKDQIATAHALGLKKMQQTVKQQNNEAINGMVTKIAHLVEVKEVK